MAFLLLSGCGSNARAPVEDRNGRGASSTTSSGYSVQRGDTLYSIAFRYGFDYRRLAAANGIPYPYTIYPGQRLQLAEADTPPQPVTRPPAVKPGSSASRAGKTAPPPSPSPAVTSSSSRSVTTSVKPASKPAMVVPNGQVKSWRWPSTGQVIRGFSSTVHKGIDIGGRRGDAVTAVAAGRVVYAGTGIVGLGQLIIVKHNDIYLSAYGHNDRLLVAEGQAVTAGQKIAEKGSSGTDTVRLHFEIRRAGKPIDPQGLLPGR